MSYAKHFQADQFEVPEFLIKDNDWVDVSYGNDVCPRWENKTRHLAIWVSAVNEEDREYCDWAQFTAVELFVNDDGSTRLGEEALFQSENWRNLYKWVQLYESIRVVDNSIAELCWLKEPACDLMDRMVSVQAQLAEMANQLK